MLDTLEQMAFALVAATSVALEETAGRELTFLGWRALVVLGAAGEPVRVSALGDRLGLSRPSVSKLVRRLERHGLLALSHDPTDARASLVALSRHGADLRARVIARRREILGAALRDPLPATLDEGLVTLAERLGAWT